MQLLVFSFRPINKFGGKMDIALGVIRLVSCGTLIGSIITLVIAILFGRIGEVREGVVTVFNLLLFIFFSSAVIFFAALFFGPRFFL
jgi:hypothetical protein